MAAIPDESELQRSKLPERIAMQTQTSVIMKEKENVLHGHSRVVWSHLVQNYDILTITSTDEQITIRLFIIIL